MELDLDAARAARAETRGDPPTVTIGGETFVLPAELPMGYVWTLVDGGEDLDALKILFDGQLDRFVATGPTREDILALIRGVPGLYGLGPGESVASDGSSKPRSSRSRPTSSASTGSTSAKPVSGRSRSG